MGMGGLSFSQNPLYHNQVTPAKLKPSVTANYTEIYHKNQSSGAESNPFTSLVNPAPATQHPSHRAPMAYTETTIGSTGYQVQTNASICNRIVKNSDGTISATWTYSPENSGWTVRGTGYNYFNGSSWGPIPTAPIENVRTGYTNIGVTSTGAEVVVSHEAANLHISQRPTKGTGAWSNASFLGSPDVWSRLAVGGANGKTLHVISQTTGGTPPNPPFQGQDGAIAYSRSLDGGLTWDKLHTVIPQIDETSYRGFGGDSYAIDAKGDTIVIVAGGFDVDVVMIKSIDNGETWTKTIVKQFPIPMYDGTNMDTDLNGDGTGDSIETNDAAVAVLLDNQGKAHVWYGNMYITEDPGAAGLSYFTSADGIMYWNESMGSTAPIMIASAADIDGDDSLSISFPVSQYQKGLTTFPSAGIDAAGNIYLSYAGIFEGVADGGSPGSGLSYRHTYVTSTPDGGVTWCTPVDVTGTATMDAEDYLEGVYGAMAKDVDQFIHLIVETDGYPGNGLTGTTPDIQGGPADIIYKKIPVADVLCPAVPTSINEKTAPSVSSLVLSPNPAESSANVSFNIASKGNVVINVYNVTGQMVSSVTNQDYAAGAHTINLNTEKYNSGIYFVNMITNEGTVSKKLIIK